LAEEIAGAKTDKNINVVGEVNKEKTSRRYVREIAMGHKLM
jgi:hypothetical protein